MQCHLCSLILYCHIMLGCSWPFPSLFSVKFSPQSCSTVAAILHAQHVANTFPLLYLNTVSSSRNIPFPSGCYCWIVYLGLGHQNNRVPINFWEWCTKYWQDVHSTGLAKVLAIINYGILKRFFLSLCIGFIVFVPYIIRQYTALIFFFLLKVSSKWFCLI